MDHILSHFKASFQSVRDGGLFFIYSDLLRMLTASPLTNQTVT